MDPQLLDLLQYLTPGSEKYRRILEIFQRHTLSGVVARIVHEEDADTRRRLEIALRDELSRPE